MLALSTIKFMNDLNGWVERLNQRYNELKRSEKLSQEKLAETLNVRQSTVSRWLKGTREPELGQFPRIAEALQVDVKWLLLGIELGEDEQHLLHDYRDCDEEGQAGIRNHARLGRLAQELENLPGQGLTDKIA